MRREMARSVGLLLCGVMFFGVPSSTAAAEERLVCPVCAKANDDAASYAEKASHTLVRGAANTLLGWTELIRQPAQEAKAGGDVFMGMAKGLGESVKRTLVGAGEVLTFWTPKQRQGYLHLATDCPICMGKKP